LRVKSKIKDLQTISPTKIWFPSNITFEVIYHTYPDNTIKLLDAQLRLENFNYVKTKDVVEEFFRAEFNDYYNKSLLDTALFGFTYDKYTNIFMGDFNFILENIYAKTSQFKSYFQDYFSYKDQEKIIKNYYQSTQNLKNQCKKI
jgi:hypothetical protein